MESTLLTTLPANLAEIDSLAIPVVVVRHVQADRDWASLIAGFHTVAGDRGAAEQEGCGDGKELHLTRWLVVSGTDMNQTEVVLV